MTGDVDRVRDRQEGGEDVADHGVNPSQEDRELREKIGREEREAEIVRTEMKDPKSPRSIEGQMMNRINLMMNPVDSQRRKDR